MNNQIKSGEQYKLENLIRLFEDTKDIIGNEKLTLQDPDSPNIVYSMWVTKRSINFSVETPNRERTHFELICNESKCTLGQKIDNFDVDLETFVNGKMRPLTSNAAEIVQRLKEKLSTFQKPENFHDWQSDAIAFALQS